MVTIGSTRIDTNIFLAPLSGCSDLAFRLIAREHGAKFCFFEMVDSNSIVYGGHRKSLSILDTNGQDTPIAAQVLGEDPSSVLRAATTMLERSKASFMDINAACPVKKVIKKGAGAYLLKNSGTLCKIIKKLALALPIPVTVKIRSGFEVSDIKLITGIAKKCESSGASAIFIHGRSRAQGYAGEVDYKAIKAVKESVKIPVFGTGNIFSGESAKRMFDETGCDGISVARGALGNPWIFQEIESHLKSGAPSQPVPLETRKAVLKKHLSYVHRYRRSGSPGIIGFMRKIALWYLKGFPNAAKMRHQISVVNDYEKMLELIDS
ncbi:MAG: tRNA dihydrouridine synthase DusB [Candidatus Omnitrophota bacterium]